MGKKKRNQKHGGNEVAKPNLKLPKATGKYFWHDGYWTDPRININTTTQEFETIRNDWKNLEWVKTTEWYKEKLKNGELEKH